MEQAGTDRRVAFLKTVPPFESLSEEEIEKLSQGFQIRNYGNRDFIIHQEDTSCDLFVIKTGKVRILTLSSSGNESCLRVFSSGAVFGELSACDGSPRSASVQAIGPCTLFVMPQRVFLEHLSSIPNLSIGFIRFLSEKLRWTTLFSHTIAQYDTPGRLLHLIIHYNEMMGTEIIPGKSYEVDLSLTQSDLASMVGAHREWVNRLLRKWRKEELLNYNRGKIVILDLPAMKAERDRRMAVLQEEEW